MAPWRPSFRLPPESRTIRGPWSFRFTACAAVAVAPPAREIPAASERRVNGVETTGKCPHRLVSAAAEGHNGLFSCYTGIYGVC